MRKLLFFLMSLSFFSFSFAALSIDSFLCDSDIAVGNTIICSATIRNTGSSSVSLTEVSLYIDGNWVEQTSYTGTGFSSSLEAGAMTTATFANMKTTSPGVNTFNYLTVNSVPYSKPSETTVNVISIKAMTIDPASGSTMNGDNFTVSARITAGGSFTANLNLSITSGSCTLASGETASKSLSVLSDNSQGSTSWKVKQSSNTCTYLVTATGTSGVVSATRTDNGTRASTAAVCSSVWFNLCLTEATCTAAGGYWCSSACQSTSCSTSSTTTSGSTISYIYSFNQTLPSSVTLYNNETKTFQITVGNNGTYPMQNTNVTISNITGFAGFAVQGNDALIVINSSHVYNMTIVPAGNAYGSQLVDIAIASRTSNKTLQLNVTILASSLTVTPITTPAPSTTGMENITGAVTLESAQQAIAELEQLIEDALLQGFIIDDIQALLQQAKDAITAGNYASVRQTALNALNQLNAQMAVSTTDGESDLLITPPPKAGFSWIYAVLIGVVSAGAVIAVLFKTGKLEDISPKFNTAIKEGIANIELEILKRKRK